ncbi:MAG: class I adenylate-forming enzyme family protein [Candidatus Udaeobacter sp.]
MKSEDPLLAAWGKTLSQKNDQPAILSSTGQIAHTFRQIEERARQFEAKIEHFDAGEVIAVQIGNHEDWPSIFVACLRKQLVVVPVEQSISDEQRDAALQICRASAVVSAVPSGTSPKILRLRTADTTAAWHKNPPTVLKLTSGTTATPRLVRFRSEQLLADCNRICDTMRITDADLNFGVIPISHSYGFSNLLTPLIARGVPMVLSRDRTPRAILADLARTNATVLPGMPLFYQAFCEINDTPALPNLRLCISAGVPLPITVAKKFVEKFKKPIHSFYGASECGGICYDRDGRSDIEGFVGQPMNGVEVELVDATATSSQIRVRSAATGDGYFPKPDEGKLGSGTFIPDDLLAREASGFKIVGRISDLINVAGKKVNPAEVEAHLLRFGGVRQAVVFGRQSALRNEEVAACVVASPHVSESDLLRFCRGGLSAWQVPKQIFIVDAIPTNERGKISRRDLARRFSTTGESSPLRRLGS